MSQGEANSREHSSHQVGGVQATQPAARCPAFSGPQRRDARPTGGLEHRCAPACPSTHAACSAVNPSFAALGSKLGTCASSSSWSRSPRVAATRTMPAATDDIFPRAWSHLSIQHLGHSGGRERSLCSLAWLRERLCERALACSAGRPTGRPQTVPNSSGVPYQAMYPTTTASADTSRIAPVCRHTVRHTVRSKSAGGWPP